MPSPEQSISAVRIELRSFFLQSKRQVQFGGKAIKESVASSKIMTALWGRNWVFVFGICVGLLEAII